MVDLITIVAFVVITYLLYDHLLRMVTVGSYGDKFVVVTGCDSGFGQRLAIRLDSLGFNVFAGCLTEDGRLHLSQNSSNRLLPFLLDVRNSDSILLALNLVKRSLPEDKGLWGLVNNAGVIGNMSSSEFCTKKDYMECWDVNLLGPIEMTRTFLPLIRKASGRVINTSSAAGRFATIIPVYTLSKFGVEAYSDIVRREMYSKGVKVIIVEPGGFVTKMYNEEKVMEELQRSFDNASEEAKSNNKGIVKIIHRKLNSAPVSSNIDLVVDAYIHGLTSRFPRTRYAVGLDCRYVGIPLSYLPTFITDWFMQY